MQKNDVLPVVFFGTVIKGRQIGRTLGYPTANIIPQNRAMPNIPFGVYAGFASIEGKRYASIMSFGRAKTIGARDIAFEAHLLQYNGNLYGKELKVEVIIFLRNMLKFNSLGELKAAMREDEKKAKKLLKA